MKTKKEALKIAREVAKEFKKEKFTETMYIIGGLSTGHFDKYSDIDIIITTNKKVYSKDILPIVKKLIIKEDDDVSSTPKNEFPYRIDPKIKGIKIMLFFLLEDWVLSDIKNYRNIRKNEYSKQANYIRYKKSIVLFDKKNKFTKLVKKIPECPKKIKEYTLYERVHQLNYYLFLESGAINVERNRGNMLESQYIVGDSINAIFECIYALNNKIMTDRKWAPVEIVNFKKKPTKVEKRVVMISKLSNSNKDIDKKINILRNLSRELKILAQKQGIKHLPKF